MHQELTIDYLNKLHNDLSKEQIYLGEELKKSNTIDTERLYTRQVTLLNQLLLQILKLRNLKRQIQTEKSY